MQLMCVLVSKMSNIRYIISIRSIGVVTACVFAVGCQPALWYGTLHPQSELMQPTFCLYSHPDHPREIRLIVVGRHLDLPEDKLRWELDSAGKSKKAIWVLEYKYSNYPFRNVIHRLLGRPQPVSCVTYGQAPPGYREKMAALPLKPEQLYSVRIWGYGGLSFEDLRFIIRLNDEGIPTKLEYALVPEFPSQKSPGIRIKTLSAK